MSHHVLSAAFVLSVPAAKIVDTDVYLLAQRGLSQQDRDSNASYFTPEVQEFIKNADGFVWWKHSRHWWVIDDVEFNFAEESDAISFKLRFL